MVRNHLKSGKWGPEESHGQFFPFSVNETFEIMIMVDNQGYKIAINGVHFAEFAHRISYYEVSLVKKFNSGLLNAFNSTFKKWSITFSFLIFLLNLGEPSMH